VAVAAGGGLGINRRRVPQTTSPAAGDLGIIAGLWHQPAGPPYDCDGDGVITSHDIMCVVQHWGKPCW